MLRSGGGGRVNDVDTGRQAIDRITFHNNL